MQRFILIFTAVMFLANSFAVSVWAKPCANINEAPSTFVQAMDMSNMPCHEAQDEKQNPVKHCDGLCLCIHASISQALAMSDNIDISLPINYLQRLESIDDLIVSFLSAPPLRPPIHHS